MAKAVMNILDILLERAQHESIAIILEGDGLRVLFGTQPGTIVYGERDRVLSFMSESGLLQVINLAQYPHMWQEPYATDGVLFVISSTGEGQEDYAEYITTERSEQWQTKQPNKAGHTRSQRSGSPH